GGPADACSVGPASGWGPASGGWGPASTAWAAAARSASTTRGARDRASIRTAPRPRKGAGERHGRRILLPGPARAPPLRAPPRRSHGDGGAVALRGHHRHLPAARPDVRGAGGRRRALPVHAVAVAAAHHHADG